MVGGEKSQIEIQFSHAHHLDHFSERILIYRERLSL
jgi:hypothetical protein